MFVPPADVFFTFHILIPYTMIFYNFSFQRIFLNQKLFILFLWKGDWGCLIISFSRCTLCFFIQHQLPFCIHIKFHKYFPFHLCPLMPTMCKRSPMTISFWKAAEYPLINDVFYVDMCFHFTLRWINRWSCYDHIHI
jgi:hypothetical protein